MPSNPFDQFDSGASAPQISLGDNPFDQFDGADSGAFTSGVQGFNSTVPFGNRLTAGMGALIAAPFTDQSLSDLYNKARANERVTEKEHKGANTAGALAGLAVTLPTSFITGGENTLPIIGRLADAAQGANKTVGNFVRGSELAPDAGALAKIGNTALQSTRSAAVAAPVGAIYGYGAGEEGQRLDAATKNAELAAAVGGALPIAGAALGVGSDVVGGIANRVGSLLGNKKAQANIADNIIAKRLVAEGYSPEEISKLISQGQASGLSPTLGEATGSSGVLQAEKSILRGTGEGANTMRDALFTRNRDKIPTAINDFAAQLEGQAGDVSAAYKAASNEAASRLNTADEIFKNPAVQSTTTLGDVQGTSAGIDAIEGVKKAINSRLDELGNISNVESRSLKQAQDIVQNAQSRGNSFDALLDAKKQLDNLYLEGADSSVQKQAASYVSKFSNQINNALKELAPNTYGHALSSAKTNMAARDLTEALGNTNEGSIAALYNKVWAKPELRSDFLRKLPDDETRQQATNLFTQLENIKRGFGGSDTAFNLPANQQLSQEAGLGFNPAITNPLKSTQSILEKIGGYAQPGVYKNIAEQSINPNALRIRKAMVKAGDSSIVPPNGAPVGAAIGTLNQPQSTPLHIDINRGAGYVPDNMIPPAPASALEPRADIQSQQNNLFSRVIQQESGGNQAAVSKKGAIGVAQILPATAREAADAAGLPFDATRFRTDPNYNAALGQAYLGKLQNKYGNDALALMAYNWGQGNVDMWLQSGARIDRIPAETRNYLQRILS